MKLIRSGITRDVLLVGDLAIKVPTPRYGLWSLARGLLANKSEAEWSTIRGLNTVLFSAWGIVNVYRRATPLTSEEERILDYEAIAEDFCPIGDRKGDNVGWVNGEVVWIDYDYSWNGLKYLPRNLVKDS